MRNDKYQRCQQELAANLKCALAKASHCHQHPDRVTPVRQELCAPDCAASGKFFLLRRFTAISFCLVDLVASEPHDLSILP